MYHKKISKSKKRILISFCIIFTVLVSFFLWYYFNTWTSFSESTLSQNINDYETVITVLQEDYEKNYCNLNKQISYDFNSSNNLIYAKNSEQELQLSEVEQNSFEVVKETCEFAFDSTSLEYLTVSENNVIFYTQSHGGALIYSKNGEKPNKEMISLTSNNMLIKKINHNWYFASIRYDLF